MLPFRTYSAFLLCLLLSNSVHGAPHKKSLSLLLTQQDKLATLHPPTARAEAKRDIIFTLTALGLTHISLPKAQTLWQDAHTPNPIKIQAFKHWKQHASKHELDRCLRNFASNPRSLPSVLHPYISPYERGRGHFLRRGRHTTQAIRWLSKVSPQNTPDYEKSLFILGVIANIRQDQKQMLTYFRALLQRPRLTTPTQPIYKKLKRLTQHNLARAHYAAANQSPGDKYTHLRRAKVLYTSLMNQSHSADIASELAHVYLLSYEHKKAQALLKKTLTQYPHVLSLYVTAMYAFGLRHNTKERRVLLLQWKQNTQILHKELAHLQRQSSQARIPLHSLVTPSMTTPALFKKWLASIKKDRRLRVIQTRFQNVRAVLDLLHKHTSTYKRSPSYSALRRTLSIAQRQTRALYKKHLTYHIKKTQRTIKRLHHRLQTIHEQSLLQTIQQTHYRGVRLFNRNKLSRAHQAFNTCFAMASKDLQGKDLSKKTRASIEKYQLFSQYYRGWCDYNKGHYSRALQKWKWVFVRSYRNTKMYKKAFAESVAKDMLQAYTYRGSVKEVYRDFRKHLPKKKAFMLMKKLAKTYEMRGNYPKAMETYRWLLQKSDTIAETPYSRELIFFQRQLTKMVVHIHKAERGRKAFLALFRYLSPKHAWYKKWSGVPKVYTRAIKQIESLIVFQARVYGRKSHDKQAFATSTHIIKAYLSLKPKGSHTRTLHKQLGRVFLRLAQQKKRTDFRRAALFHAQKANDIRTLHAIKKLGKP